jgi:HTH-type transcriptional regulator/antitoxin HigA
VCTRCTRRGDCKYGALRLRCIRQRRVELNDCQQNILLENEAPKTISSPPQHEVYISRLLELQRKAHRTAEETQTAKALIVLIADYEGKHFTIEKASGVKVLKELMDANGLRQKDLAEDLGGESIVSLILQEKRQLNRTHVRSLGSS